MKRLLGFLLLSGSCLAQVIFNGGAGGVTNAAGNNVVTKSNGTNLVASTCTDTGTTINCTDNQLSVGPADTVTNGAIGLNGKTSGTATITAPAVAGTVTNPIAISNALNFPSGVALSWNADTGLSRSGAAIVMLGNGTQGDSSGTFIANRLRVPNNGMDINGGVGAGIGLGSSNLVKWNSNSDGSGQDTGISRISAGVLAFGNGTANDKTANLQFGKVTSYNSIATVDNGVPSEIGHIDLTVQGAALSATTVCTPSATGRFRISVYEKVTTAASVSSVLGGASGTTLTYTDGTDSVAQSVVMAMDTATGTVALTAAGNTTTTLLTGTTYIYALTGVAIQVAVGYTSTNSGEMKYAVRATCEAL